MTRHDTTRLSASKVPLIAAVFWAIKLLTTAFGEGTSDYLVNTINPYIAVIGGFIAFAVALAIQFSFRRYVAWAYWLAVTMVAVFGTMAADVTHIQFGVPYVVSTPLFALTLVVVFTTWYRVEGTLAIHSIRTIRRELFYWTAVLTTFAMGTAAGDLAAYTAKLGFLSAGLIFTVAFLLPGLAWRFGQLNAIAAFWLSYILTRPVGASFADWMGKARHAGGLGWGDGPVAGVLLTGILGLVAYLTVTGVDRESEAAA